MRDDLERLFRSVFDRANVAALAIDVNGGFVAGNDALRAIFATPIGEGFAELAEQLCLGTDGLEERSSAVAPSLDGRPARHRYRRADGTFFLGDRSNLPISDASGGQLGVISIIRNVSAEAGLAEGLASLASIPATGAEQAFLAIAGLIDIGCRLFSAGHGSLLGIEGEGYVVEVASGSWQLHREGDKLPRYETFHALPHDYDDLLIVERCSLSDLADHAYCRGSGVQFFMAGKVRVNGRVYGSLCFADQRPRPQPLTTEEKLLFRIIAQWSGLLLEGRLTRTALDIANQDLARFSHIASHDLQEPLRRIVTYCQILMEDFGTEVSEEAAEVVEIIQTGGRRMRIMLNDLLIYSSLNQELQRAFEPVDMASVLHHAIEDLAGKLEASRGHVEAVPLPLVWGRAPLLQTVCYHLISNAIKYAGDRSPQVDIAIRDEGRFWRFQITDRGIGIEPRFAERIFDIFKRLHPRDDFSGSGAGLAICKLIIERHGGAIWLDQDYRDGARFLFTLPKGRWSAMP